MQYDNIGRRVNTRDDRYRKRLEDDGTTALDAIWTRDYRYLKDERHELMEKLSFAATARPDDERHNLIEEAMKIIPDYHQPQDCRRPTKTQEEVMKAIPDYHPPQDYGRPTKDYRRPTKTEEKVYVPVNDYPEG
ncbi:uncharacterized protein BDZ99DRAFT_525830 [Mytilinidion resinicola]|uniref:Uncharacterized protein n=1 Tax=Mytilinidion resinicola TaxID=574789 RepID=A0A6A6Y6T5_9PEZI|nr:uncharacterized protein BDZ99DRAFT_525830 [Mytilinidion resinicola]KAF2804238.1 hypothetical protein BDZ99DRAFT_525830 [Mytilinidion resinicola]